MQAQKQKICLTAITCLTIGLALGWFLRGAAYHDMILIETEKSAVLSPGAEVTPEKSTPLPSLRNTPGETSAPINTNIASASLVEDDAEAVHSDAEAPSGRINLNSASAIELQMIPGIGEVLSQRIIDYRDANGGFQTVQELMEIKGIGEKTFAKIADYVEVR